MEKDIREMVLHDVPSLLEKFFSDGFTIECLSKATGVSVEQIEKAYAKEKLSSNDNKALNPVLYFLMQLYAYDTRDSAYLKDIAAAIVDCFGLPTAAISNYLGIDENSLAVFLNNPKQHTDGYHLTVKLLHLFTSLVREKDV